MRELAEQDYRNGMKYKDIAEKYNVTINTVKSWKTRYGWQRGEKSAHTKNKKVCTQKGGQPGNQNALGHGPPAGNKNAEKYGFFSKFLPEETQEIFSAIEQANPLDLLWHQIQIAYAAIIRAQKIMYAKEQHEWKKQESFLQAQARAQGELRSLIKQYDDMLHKNWELATEEQKARISVLTSKLNTGNEETEDDGFLDALEGKVVDVWNE